MTISMAVVASAGFLSFLSPCILPLVPSCLAFVAGASLGDLRERPRRGVRRTLLLNALGFMETALDKAKAAAKAAARGPLAKAKEMLPTPRRSTKGPAPMRRSTRKPSARPGRRRATRGRPGSSPSGSRTRVCGSLSSVRERRKEAEIETFG
jgi:hypothetical protein